MHLKRFHRQMLLEGGELSNSRPFRRKLLLPRSMAVRRAVSRLAAEVNRTWINGQQPINGLFTLVGTAELLPRGHAFRKLVARTLRARMRDRLRKLRPNT